MKISNKNNVLHLIAQKKKELYQLAFSYGFTNEKTLKCSEKLDQLILKEVKSKM